MNAAAKRTMPVGLGIRVLARLWLATCGSGLRACWSGSSKRCGCDGRHMMTTGAASAALFAMRFLVAR